jgi:hypothetical protein
MSNPYTDSPYAHERVGFDLHCEASPGFPLREGSVPKCVHCANEYEHHAEHPQPCIERIAMALEEARGGVVRVGDPVRDPSTGGVVGTVLPMPEPVFSHKPGQPWSFVQMPVTWLRAAIAASEPWTPPPGFVVVDEPADPSAFDKAAVRVRWPGAWAQLIDEGGYDYPRWGILGTRLDVCPTGDTEAEAWAEAAQAVGDGR